MTNGPDRVPSEPSDEGIGCREGVLAGLALLAGALVVGGIGLTLVVDEACTGVCAATGLTLFYAGAPASALFGVIGGGIPIAWPLDAGIWLVLGMAAASWSGRRGRSVWRGVALVAAAALLFGIVMARFVEVDRMSV